MALATEFGIGELALADIIESLARPGRDPRDDLPPPIFRRDVIKLDDLEVGMELHGTVLNVVDFGAFVDVGLPDSGLVHVSQLANTFVRDPHDAVAVGDQVRVWVTSIDKERRRVALTMIEPGTEKPPEERAKHGGRREKPRKDGRRDPAAKDGRRRGRKPQGRAHRPRHEKRARPPKKPVVPITEAMAEGKEPMRTFGDLAQFFDRKDEPGEEEKEQKKA
jgi:uncharacterized protein